MSVGIYRFNWDSRGGSLSGIFAATTEEVKALEGQEVYFGEVLGKHSEVYGTIDPGEITLVTDDPTAVDMFCKYRMDTGYDPRSYMGSEDEE